MATRRLTMAQALLGFLKNQYVERDGVENRFFAGAWGIFGHGNVAGIGQALQQNPDFRYYQCRNEQATVHIATAFAKSRIRLPTFACTSSIGPGATNMITGAATATINRLPVLLLPGDIFARRNVAPVLQQLESRARPGHLGERLLQAGLALLGSHQPAGPAALRAAGSHARADVAGGDRRGDAGAAAGRADRGVRLSRRSCSRSASGTFRAAGPEPAMLARAVEWIRAAQAAADRRRRRRALQRGDARRWRASASRPASRWARRRRARARWRSTIRRTSAPSA